MKNMFTKLTMACCALVTIFLLSITTVSAQYCPLSGNSFADDHITNVTFAGIDNTTGATAYSDFTSISATVVPGATYPISAKLGNDEWTETLTVYIDWDQSGTFEASERYNFGSCTEGNCQNPGISGTIEVPVTALPGETTMRVIGKFSSPPTGPCNTDGPISYGEVEDYSVIVQSGVCTPPTFTYTVTNNCENETYSVSALLTDFGTSNFITVFLTRSDEVPVSPVTLISAIQGQTVNIINNIPFGVTVTASIEGSNPICNLTRNFESLICPAPNDEPCTATVLACGDEVTGVFLGATQSFDDACFGSGTADVWFKFVSDGSQAYTISETSSADVIVDLWSGTDCSESLTPVTACADSPEFVTTASAGTYYFRIRPYSSASTYTVSLSCVDFASNDEACTATVLTCGESVSGTLLGATQSFDDACYASGTADVWFKIVSDGQQKYTIAETSSSDMIVDLWSGTDCGAISQIAACKDSPENFAITEAGTYYFRIRAYSTATTYDVSLTCVPFECPALLADIGSPCDDGNSNTYNDVVSADCECAGYIPQPGEICEVPLNISNLPFTATGTTDGFGDDYGGYTSANFIPIATGAITNGTSYYYYLNGDDIVYAYTPSETQALDISVTNHGTYTGVFVFTGCPFASTKGYAVNSSASANLEINGLIAEAGQTYYIVISTWATPQVTSFTLNISSAVFDCPAIQANFGSACDDGDPNTNFDVINEDCECAGIPIPVNDVPCTATALACGDTLVDQNMIGATMAFTDACFGSGSGDIWYSFTAAEGYAYQVSEIRTTGGDMVVSLHTGDDCGNLTQVGNCQDSPENYIVTTPGNYYFRIRPYSTATSAIVTLSCTTLPENDECTEAIDITCGNTYTGSTIASATYPAGQLFCGPSAPSSTNGGNWYTITPDSDMEITLDLSASAFDTKIWLYSGACGSLTCVAGDDDGGEGTRSKLVADLTAGTTYYIFVSGYSSNRGDYTLNVSCVNFACSPTIESVVASNAEGAPVSCIDLNLPYYLTVTLSGGTQASYNVTAGNSPAAVINANGTGLVGPITGANPIVNVTGSTDASCGATQSFTTINCPPSNDEACNATVITCGQTITQNFDGATLSLDDACNGSGTQDVWFKFTADGTQSYTIAETGVVFFDAVVGLYQGDDCGNLVSVAPCQDSPESYTVTTAGTYYFYVRPYSATSSNLVSEISLTCAPFDCPGVGNIGVACDDGNPNTVNDVVTADCQCAGEPVAANNEVCTATSMTCGTPLTGTFSGATASFYDSCNGSGEKDLWFSFVADGTQTYTVAETTSSDMVVTLHTGTDCNNLTQVGSCQDSPENFTVSQAGTYYFRIRPYSSATTYTVSLTCTPFDCPGVGNIGDPCDDGNPDSYNDVITADCSCQGHISIPGEICELPIDVITLPYTSSGNTADYLNDYTTSDVPPLAPNAITNGTGSNYYITGNDVVYAYTPTTDEVITISTTNDNDWIGLWVFTGCPFANTVAYHTSTSGTTREIPSLPVTAGVTYYIVISTWTAPESTDYTLTITSETSTAANLNGTVNWNSNCGERDATVKLYTPNTATLIETYNVTIAANGTFTIADLPSGTFDMIVKVQGYLAKGIQDVEIAAGENTVAVGTIRNGNVNNDNSINLFDISLINAAFNKSSGQSGYNPLADLNCDGSINIFDISILNASFNKAGAVAPL